VDFLLGLLDLGRQGIIVGPGRGDGGDGEQVAGQGVVVAGEGLVEQFQGGLAEVEVGVLVGRLDGLGQGSDLRRQDVYHKILGHEVDGLQGGSGVAILDGQVAGQDEAGVAQGDVPAFFDGLVQDLGGQFAAGGGVGRGLVQFGRV